MQISDRRPIYLRVPEGTEGALHWPRHGSAPECWVIPCDVDPESGHVQPAHLSVERATEALRLARSRQRRREAIRSRE